MEITIRDYSIESAFERIYAEIENQGIECETPNFNFGFINITNNEGVTDIDVFKESGVIFGTELDSPGENTRDLQTRVENTPTKGSKTWETRYMGIFDRKDGMSVVPGSAVSMKGECIQICRDASQETSRNTFVIIGKSAVEFSRCQAEIQYVPSSGQASGVYKFVW
tara:strand:- start:1816 stop:2316 length:501 start_codon:yes stop_codon:yes gene_type:complete